MSFVTRFAPSPTGHMHLGNAFSAMTVFDAAREAGGRFLLRIEDSDRTRCKPEYETQILDDLAWLGLTWETPIRRQSEHLEEYQIPLQRLIDAGLCYRCFRTRREVLTSLANAPHDPELVYVGEPLAPDEESERSARGEVYAWRLSTARVRDFLGDRKLTYTDESGIHPVDPARLGDVVIARKDFPASYHLASVWDDAHQGVTHVIRGEDLRDSAQIHVVVQTLLGLPTPLYRHHRLILDEDGKRMAKRDQSKTIRSLREAGATPADIRNMVGLA